jgi:2'-hydroxyisoflavone reductase
MDILLIGNGVFLDAAIVDAAIGRGHRVAMFNRGRARNTWPRTLEAVVDEAARLVDDGRV